MPADREVTAYAGGPQRDGDGPELRQEELEDQREADHERLTGADPGRNLLGTVADVDELDSVAVLEQDGGEVTHPQVALVLITDQDESCP